jgi:pyruvate formate lyase activating enzyme
MDLPYTAKLSNMKNQNSITGAVHSIESLGALDGPGLRTVIFLQGCPLKCKFCHNIDCAIVQGNAQEYTVDELVKTVLKNKSYWGKTNNDQKDFLQPTTDNRQPISGGVTISGGEPTFQKDFLIALLKELKRNDIHTAVDSCSVTTQDVLTEMIPYVDLWMLSVKHMDEQAHVNLTGASNRKILENILFLDKTLSEQKENQAQIRIRFLVIPGMTDDKDHIKKLGEFVTQIKKLECLEILPYGSHGKHKWIELFGSYSLQHVRDATKEDVERVAGILEKTKIPLKY